MSNYESTDRTNYFRVKDLDAFKADLQDHAITYGSGNYNYPPTLILDESPDNVPAGAIALFAEDGWPLLDDDSVFDRGLDTDPSDDKEPPSSEYEGIEDLIAAHLVDTDVAIIMGAGHEKLRYISGYAIAINAAGDSVSINLDDIYAMAKTIAPSGASITMATY